MNKLALVLLCLLVNGCVANKQYHKSLLTCNFDSQTDMCSQSTVQIHNENKREFDYQLAFVEYDDLGQLFRRSQLESVLNSYYPVVEQKDVLLITYIHGWHHNAKQDDDNVIQFRSILQKLADQEAKKAEPRKVLGVYIGWRGESISLFPFNYLTFWDRKNTAQTFSQEGLTETLLKLEQMIDWAKSDGKHKSTKFITIGHSFGGLALYTSLQQIIVDRYLDVNKKLSADSFGDLVVLLNPAFEAARYSTLFDISQERCPDYAKLNQIPNMVILTSDHDYATRYAFPLGRFFSTLFSFSVDRLTLLDRNQCTRNNLPIHADIGVYQSNIETIGHFNSYITHSISCNKIDQAGMCDASELNFSDNELWNLWHSQVNKNEIDFGNVQLKQTGISHPLNPYLNITTDQSLIKDHNDIWNESVKNIIINFVRMATINSDLIEKK